MNKSRAELYNLNWLKFSIWGALIWCSLSASAQSYHHAIGLRTAYGTGVSYKHMITEKKALEGLMSVRWGGVVVTGLYEKHKTLGSGTDWRWYFGGGAHLGYHSRENVVNPTPEQRRNAYINIGIDGIIGLEYTIPSFPLNFSIDYKPAWDFTGDRFFVGEGLGFSVRYVLSRKPAISSE